MEFPDLGSQCAVSSCKQLDFLPFECSACHAIFCQEHNPFDAHDCLLAQSQRVATGEFKGTRYKCEVEGCSGTELVRVVCGDCRRTLCLKHRHGADHACEAQAGGGGADGRKTAPEGISKHHVLKATLDALALKSSPLAAKVNLMRLKLHATGSKTIPVGSRFYLDVVYPAASAPADAKAGCPAGWRRMPKGMFFHMTATCGKVIDAIADAVDIPNYNNMPAAKRLNLLRHPDCEQLPTDVPMETLAARGDLPSGSAVMLFRES